MRRVLRSAHADFSEPALPWPYHHRKPVTTGRLYCRSCSNARKKSDFLRAPNGKRMRTCRFCVMKKAKCAATTKRRAETFALAKRETPPPRPPTPPRLRDRTGTSIIGYAAWLTLKVNAARNAGIPEPEIEYLILTWRAEWREAHPQGRPAKPAVPEEEDDTL